MTRAEMVTEFNYWTRKRDEYKEKISRNSTVRSSLSTGLSGCESYSVGIGSYSDESVLFGDLSIKANNAFNSTFTANVLAAIDGVGNHLESEKSYAQGQINYYDSLIKQYDAEQERKRQEELRAKQN